MLKAIFLFLFFLFSTYKFQIFLTFDLELWP